MNFDDKLSLALSLRESAILIEDDDTKSPLDPRLGISARYTRYLKNLRYLESIRDGVRVAGLDDKLRQILGPEQAARLSHVDPKNPLSFEEAAIMVHDVNSSGIADEIRDKLELIQKKEVSVPDPVASSNCPYCKKPIDIPAKSAGKNITCPSCSKEFRVSSLGDLAHRDAKVAYAAQVLMDEMDTPSANVTLHQLLSPRLLAIPPKQKVHWRAEGKSHDYEFSFDKPLIDQTDILINIIKQIGYDDLWKKFNTTFKARRTLLKYFRPDMTDDQILRTAMLYTVRNIADEIDERQGGKTSTYSGLAFGAG